MRQALEVLDDAGAVAQRSAEVFAAACRAAIERSGRFEVAVSGGKTPRAMFAVLATLGLDWERVVVYQVDERVAPDGDDDRNLTHLLVALDGAPATIRPMPVGDDDLEAAAARYGASLPERFDLIHLGIGPDGHTASLVPGDPVLEVTDRPVALTAEYLGRRRMTLTYPALARTEQLLWVIAGADKRRALAQLLAGDASVPAGRVEAPASLVIADRAAT